MARDKNIIKTVQVILLRDASALLALVNIELPVAAIPPIPSPFGLCSNTKSIKSKPENNQIQLIIWAIFVINIVFKHVELSYYNP